MAWLIRWLAFRVNRKLQRKAREWPVAVGFVEHAQPKTIGEGNTAFGVGELTYSYSVDGQYYSGVLLLPASTEENARSAVQGWKDRRLAVRYLPGDPSKSTIVMEEQNLPPRET